MDAKFNTLARRMRERPGLSATVGVGVLLSALTSPKAVAHLLLILSKTP